MMHLNGMLVVKILAPDFSIACITWAFTPISASDHNLHVNSAIRLRIYRNRIFLTPASNIRIQRLTRPHKECLMPHTALYVT